MKPHPIRLVGLFLVWMAAAEPVNAGYDLKCNGSMFLLDGASVEHPSPFTMTLHVDLDHNSFCQDSCQAQEKIVRVLPSNIIFRATNSPLPNRLWVADTGQFSYTWSEVAGHDEKPSVVSAQGSCTKVAAGPVAAAESPKQSVESSKPKPTFLEHNTATSMQKTASQSRPEELSAAEITALIDIQNHHPVPALMHTRLHARGLVELKDDLWILTDRGAAIINGDRR